MLSLLHIRNASYKAWRLNINPQLYVNLLQSTSSNIISEKFDLKHKQIHDLIITITPDSIILQNYVNQSHMGNILYSYAPGLKMLVLHFYSTLRVLDYSSHL